MKTKRRKLKDKLEKIVKKIIKERDEYTCQKCGKIVQGSNCHASHIIPVSRSGRLEFDIVNIKVLCMRCHLYWYHRNPIEAAEWVKKKFPKRLEYLQERLLEPVRPIKDYEYEEMIAEFKEVND